MCRKAIDTRYYLLIVMLFMEYGVMAQTATLKGKIRFDNNGVEFANVVLKGKGIGAPTDTFGNYMVKDIAPGTYTIVVSAVGFSSVERNISLKTNENRTVNFELIESESSFNEVVVSGTMKEVSKLESPVPVELYTSKFFKANPTPSLFDALQNVNGVKPQLNCNICNTGDIHINGLEGPYTMILIDGMPIVSGLSTVYGLSGIPKSLIERVEVVKGPASTLYGSEAVGGLINVITKRPSNAPIFSTDIFATSWGEVSADVAGKFYVGKKVQSLIGASYFNYSLPIDNNKDGFTDVTLQNRISVFNKWSFDRKDNRVFSLAGRYVYEDRWGGEMNWNKKFRGGDSIYAESIYTKRWEFFGTYQLPTEEKITLQFSANGHEQNSVYGNTSYNAEQYVAFGQLTWNKKLKSNDILIGAAFRYTFYDDNTPATTVFDTFGVGKNMPSNTYLPGVFIQDEIDFNSNNKLLLGIRYDYNSIHGSILTPRINYKWNSKNKRNVLRFSVGNGYRVANIFTEDHAALTGSRKVEFIEKLKPETSWNGNINFVKKTYTQRGVFVGMDATAFYTYFTNKIIADYLTNPNKIIYNNLKGYAVSRGVSLNLDVDFNNGLKFLVGCTLMDVYSVENKVKKQQLFTEHFTGVWNVGYTFRKIGLSLDYTGNVYSPMNLPLLSDSDPRRAKSPWWSIQNIQVTKKFKIGIEIYGGVKNLLNWTPNRGSQFIIARSNDPFDKNVQFDANGKAIATPSNPYGLTFDPSYIYGPNQGVRGFMGIRYTLK